ncbi:Mss4p nuclear export [Coemansia sp. RSA 2711]|nr:Mss4p nuclear export [Coemansia sp. RSA 2711]KAJ2311797.1 Mss4p nuclear export [Coemansia sp. RSA 2705]KAJ2325619.1 Mss4p nuclear export [Coemansia sp. RSA 2702]
MGEKRGRDSDGSGSSDEGSTSDGSLGSNEIVNVDFEFFDPMEIDFHAMKRLLQAAFGDDADMFDVSGLVDLVISQRAIGSTVKMDGDADPYAFLSVVDYHAQHACVAQMRQYLDKKAGRRAAELAGLLQGRRVGWLLSERVINMPPQVVVPMLRMLLEETKRTPGFDFEYFVLVCPMYREVAAEDADEDEKALDVDAYAHAEDEFIEEFACLKFDYRFSQLRRVADARNSFGDAGLAPSRRCLVLPRAQMGAVVARLEEVLEL